MALFFFFSLPWKHFLGKLFVLTVLGFRAYRVRSGPALDLKASIAPHLLSLLLVRSVAADPAASFPFHLKAAVLPRPRRVGFHWIGVGRRSVRS